MKMRSWLLSVALTGTLLVAVTACLSTHNRPAEPSSERAPAAVEASEDRAFVQKGYEEATHRKMQEGRELAQDQVIQEMAGREIWYKSAPNGRFHAYVFGQRINAPIDWYRVMRTDQRFQRFNIWGVMNDPDCCTPGQDCDSKGRKFQNRSVTLKDTYGFDYCPGDEELLSYIGREDMDYRKVDPACTNKTIMAADQLDANPRQNRCDLAFGTSTGAIGFRKFPNPRFNAKHWAKINEQELAKRNKSWNGYSWDGMTLREVEASVEPPFRVAISCASCHVAFDPAKPPRDVNHPEWSNLSGTVGNQYVQISEILGSGTRPDSLENQLFIPASRPGTSDTSAVPNDLVGNPGTINPIINIPQRPTFKDKVTRWFHESSDCTEGSKDCQVVTYPDGRKKFWKLATKEMDVFHILKGGEDTVGADIAVQRVYVNIGMCAEQCWMNHHLDLRTLNPHERGFRQTPFNIAQCRRDCAPWRANEDRVGNIIQFLLSARPTDLKDALMNTSVIRKTDVPEANDAKFVSWIERQYGIGAISKGQSLFANNCATCHSSQNQNKADGEQTENTFGSTDFLQEVTLPSGEIIRKDWLGNEKSTRADLVGTYSCRALHSNHMKGHLWEQFSSETYKSKPGVLRDAKGQLFAGGRGYFRNISLVNVWAYAPFLHNNAVGPEICGRPQGEGLEVHNNTHEGMQTDETMKRTCDAKFDPSVQGRLQLFNASMDELLTPEADRKKKITRADVNIRFPLGLSIRSLGGPAQKLYLEFPKGMPIAKIGNFDLKSFVADLFGALPYIDKPAEFDNYWKTQVGPESGPRMAAAVRGTLDLMKTAKDAATFGAVAHDIQKSILENNNARLNTYLEVYSNCNAHYENVGHTFGASLSEDDKKALKAFLLTL